MCGQKKRHIYIVLGVARETGLIGGADVMTERSLEQMQALVDSLPDAQRYCTDAFNVYDEMIWPAQRAHSVSVSKEATHTIASVHANLPTYLARLARRSR